MTFDHPKAAGKCTTNIGKICATDIAARVHKVVLERAMLYFDA